MPTPPITFYFDLGSPFAYLAAERLQHAAPRARALAAGPARRTVQADRPQLLGARRLPAPAGGDGRDRAPRARVRPAADALAGPVARRLPDRDARDHVRVLRRARARVRDAGLPRRVPARIGAERRRERARSRRHAPASIRTLSGRGRATPRSSRHCATPPTRRTIGACSACPRSRSATSCSGAMTGSRTPPPICRPPATMFDPGDARRADRPGAARRRSVDARARDRRVRGRRPRVRRGGLQDPRRGARTD